MPVYCGHRFCPVCSVTRAIRVRHRLNFLVAHQNPHPGTFMAFLTLTIVNQSDLPKMIADLQKAFRRLRNRQYWRTHILGGASVIEITGHPGNWHAHIHAIIQTRWIDWTTLRNQWHKVSKSIGVYIKRIPTAAAVGYISKYVTKSDAPETVLNQISQALRGVRLFAPIGDWYHLNKKYQRPVTPCPNCHQSKWVDYSSMFSGNFEPIYREFEVADPPDPPPTEPDLTQPHPTA